MNKNSEYCQFRIFPTTSTVHGSQFDGVGFDGSENPKINYMLQCSLDSTIWGDLWADLKQQFIDANNPENSEKPICGLNDCSEWKILNKIAYVSDIYDPDQKFTVSIEDWEKFIIAVTHVKNEKSECELSICFL
jgi:hypothetical protein